MKRSNPPRGALFTKENMIDSIREVDPDFALAWERLVLSYGTACEVPQYQALMEFAVILVGKLEKKETSSFPAVFAIVELWHTDGDAFVQEAATIGLLEGIQNMSSHREVPADGFTHWLGPVTLTCWHELNRFWSMIR